MLSIFELGEGSDGIEIRPNASTHCSHSAGPLRDSQELKNHRSSRVTNVGSKKMNRDSDLMNSGTHELGKLGSPSDHGRIWTHRGVERLRSWEVEDWEVGKLPNWEVGKRLGVVWGKLESWEVLGLRS